MKSKVNAIEEVLSVVAHNKYYDKSIHYKKMPHFLLNLFWSYISMKNLNIF